MLNTLQRLTLTQLESLFPAAAQAFHYRFREDEVVEKFYFELECFEGTLPHNIFGYFEGREFIYLPLAPDPDYLDPEIAATYPSIAGIWEETGHVEK